MKRVVRLFPFVGPALVAGVAYIDPGNVASNMSAGARFGYLLVWVVVCANVVAWVVQYLSAKLGLATGMSLTEHVGQRLASPWARRLYWAQAELAAMATYVAELFGGAVALNLLFGVPLVVGGIITATVSLAILTVHNTVGIRTFERVIMALLVVIAAGFVASLFVNAPDWSAATAGILPRFAGTESVVLAASIVGATVMPHAIYAHSALTRDRFANAPLAYRPKALSATRLDVTIALVSAGVVNVAMLLIGAVNLTGLSNGEGPNAMPSLADIYGTLAQGVGPVVATLFAVALLASGLASSSVASYAGADIMHGLIRTRVPLWIRRVVPTIPALALLAVGADPVLVLVLSQVVLSFGIPFALVPLIRLTSSTSTMGVLANSRLTAALATAMAALLIALNVWLIVSVVGGA